MHHVLLAARPFYDPGWFGYLNHVLRLAIRDHQALGTFAVVFAEELGIPLPAPGDVFIAFTGYLTTKGNLSLLSAYIAVVGGAVLGSASLMTLTKRFGRPLVVRFGGYIGITPNRLEWAEAKFRKYGIWSVIIGRHIPGMRIVLSAFAGLADMPFRYFVPSVFVSALAWATIFLYLGRALGPRVLGLFHLVPAHLVPWILWAAAVLVFFYLAWEHGIRHRLESRKPSPEHSR